MVIAGCTISNTASVSGSALLVSRYVARLPRSKSDPLKSYVTETSRVHPSAMLVFLLLLFAAPGRAADLAPDPADLIRRAVAAMEKSWEETRLYSHKESRVSRSTASLLPFREQSSTWEITPVDGRPHATMIERDGYRLSAAERQEYEEMKQRLAQVNRAVVPPPEPSAPFSTLLPFDRISKSYDLQLIDDDPTRWCIEGKLKRKPLPPTPTEKFVRAVQFVLVLDRAESQIVRMEVKQNYRGKPHMSTLIERERVLDSVLAWTHVRQ